MKKFFVSCLIIFAVFTSACYAYDFSTDSGLSKAGQESGLEMFSISFKDDPTLFFGKIIEIVLSFIGVLFLILLIYGGYTYMLARGNDDEVKKALDVIKNAIIGLVIVLSAYAITSLFVGLWTQSQ